MIEKYYVDEFIIKKATVAKVNGVNKTTYSSSTTKLGKIDPLKSVVVYQSGNQQIVISHKLFCSNEQDIVEKDIIVYGQKEFNVIQVINPFSSSHHLEVMLESRY